MNISNIITENMVYIGPALAAVASWFTSRKFKERQLKEADNNVDSGKLDNISKNFELYQSLIEDLETKFKNRVLDLEIDLEKMKTLNGELRMVINNNEKYINKLRFKLSKYEKLD